MGGNRVPRSGHDYGSALRSLVLLGAVVGAVAVVTGVLLILLSGGQVAGTAGFVPAVCVLMCLGTLVVFRRPRNVVGWLCHAAGVVASLAFLSGSYVDFTLATRPGSLPAPAVGWFSLWLGSAWVWILLVIPLVFPDGHLPSRRWRPATWIAVGVMLVDCMERALNPTAPAGETMPYNPLGIVGAERFFAVLEQVTNVGLAIPLILAALTVVVRFRRSSGIERLQLKWLTYALGQLVAVFAVNAALPSGFPQPFSDIIFGISFGLLPVAIAMAVLRYRLYDIDRLISRTISYGVVTALLVGTYLLLVIAMQEVMPVRGDVAVAAATLAVAALFNPLRRRVQTIVDRRFNRPHYDAVRTIEAFSQRQRSQVDMTALADDLETVAAETMQPASVWLWLRSQQ